MECFKQKCLGGCLCEVAGCVLKNHLFKGRELKIIRKCGSLTGKELDRKIISLLDGYQPMRVSDKQVDHYYYWIRRGYDLDRGDVPPTMNLQKPKQRKQPLPKPKPVKQIIPPKQTREEKLFLQSQTLEQFKEKRNWDEWLKNYHETPEPNFHCEN